MATVKVEILREQAAHFGLYRTSLGGDDSIIVRRKVGEPTDYLHSKSRKLIRQRENLALASQHYASLTPRQKAYTRRQIDFVEYQQSHGKTDTKLLTGRQLFIAREMKALHITGKPLVLPHEICIILCDNGLNPLEGELWLRYLEAGEWHDTQKEELYTGHWLFSQVPKGKEAYRVEGEVTGYFDPKKPESQYMTEDELNQYHYHIMELTTIPGEFISVFYPDPSPEITSVDGWIRAYRTDLWEDIRVGDGDEVRDNTSGQPILIVSSTTQDMWRSLGRAFYLFPTFNLPPNCTIIKAELHIYVKGKGVEGGIWLSLSVYDSYPLSNTQLVLADYSRVSATRLANIITYPNIVVDAYNVFTLNSSGLAAINKEGITKFALRNVNYDAWNIEPPWSSFVQSYISVCFSEAEPYARPKLVVTYTLPE